MNARDFARRVARITAGAGDRHRNRGKGYKRKALDALARRVGAALIVPRGRFIGYRLPGGAVVCLKERFHSESDATFELDRIAEQSAHAYIPVRAYKCPWCAGYHLTSRA